ncbi:hypothetical protein PILCRDRAFT_45503, partial [Piloderma croceum F 1598]
IVRLLLDKGANVTHFGKSGTALTAASRGGHEVIARLLLARGAEIVINADGQYSGTALFAASEKGHENIVRLLLDKGADVAHSGTDGTALVAASEGGHEAIARLLLDQGAGININAEGEFKGTALFAAS